MSPARRARASPPRRHGVDPRDREKWILTQRSAMDGAGGLLCDFSRKTGKKPLDERWGVCYNGDTSQRGYFFAPLFNEGGWAIGNGAGLWAYGRDAFGRIPIRDLNFFR